MSSTKGKIVLSDDEKKKIINARALAHYYKNVETLAPKRSKEYSIKRVNRLCDMLKNVEYTTHKREQKLRNLEKQLNILKTTHSYDTSKFEINRADFLPAKD